MEAGAASSEDIASTLDSSASSPRHEHDHDGLTRRQSTGSGITSFTFVVNDPATGSQASFGGSDSSGNPDRFAHTRTKRKRTSPEDFAILECEYEKDPRPDRNKRNTIAMKVALNEKEVQIWFQNRRQMTRRKARTWQPNEISSIIHSQNAVDSSGLPHAGNMSSSQEFSSSQSSMGEKSEDTINERPGSGVFVNASQSSFESAATGHDRVEDPDDKVAYAVSVENEEVDPVNVIEGRAGQESGLKEVQDAEIDHAAIPDETRSTNPVKKVDRSLKRSKSNMRMRMSLEGKAELVFDKDSPSPPSKDIRRESWPARGPLQRSQSAITPSAPSLVSTTTDVPSSSLQSAQPWNRPRPVGSSRDARTWEFYCDAESRDALTIAAEHDRKGNAQGALGLLRSNSGTAKHKITGSPLTPNFRKQNSHIKRSVDSDAIAGEKRKSLDKLNSDRPKLARTSSSVARLQTSDPAVDISFHSALPPASRGAKKKKASNKKGVEIFEDNNDDSDKENWQPGTRVSAPTHPCRHMYNQSSRQPLGINLREISHESSIGALLASENVGNISNVRRKTVMPQVVAGQNQDVAADIEVAAFMGETTSSPHDEDMDAVQNLLRLRNSSGW